MNDALIPLLWCSGAGWFLLTYLLGLGGSRSAAQVLVWTVFYWLLAIDPVAILLGIIAPLAQKIGIGWRFVLCFDVLPWLFCALRLRWLRARQAKAAAIERR